MQEKQIEGKMIRMCDAFNPLLNVYTVIRQCIRPSAMVICHRCNQKGLECYQFPANKNDRSTLARPTASQRNSANSIEMMQGEPSGSHFPNVDTAGIQNANPE